MTTTSRRPPRTTTKRQPPRRRRPAEGTADGPGAPARTAAKAPAPKTPAKGPPKGPPKTSGKTPAKAPAKTRKAAPKAPSKAPKTAPKTAVKTPVQTGARQSAGQPPRAPFILLIVALLAGALVSLLLLNTVLAKDAFTLTGLQQNTERLAEREQELKLQIAEGNSPEKIAAGAERLDMKPSEVPVFFDVDNGTTSGDPVLRPVPHADAAAAGAASVVGVPGTIVPGDGAAR